MDSAEQRAREALTFYGMQAASLQLLRTLGNVVARVEGPAGLFALRACAPTVTAGRLAEELVYLDSVAATGLTVPRPVADRQGARVSGEPGRHAVLFRWIEGEPVSQHMGLESARTLGALTARLHAHGRGHVVPTHPWVGPRYDARWLHGPDSWWQTRAPGHLGAEVVARLGPAIARCTTVLETRAGRQQVIHSDLHFGNVLRTPDGWAVIDFDSCALGDPAFDLAVTENEFMDFPDGPELIAAFREAYAEVTGAAYPAGAAELLRVASSVAFLEWVYESPNGQVREQKLRWVPQVLADMEAQLPI